ncbi:hypothetical protein [Nocardia blacklockiae]|uniref:hypothetical protein n=1 Tax=Nocardia blacklockiae TaxID=480036 RepID=UPI001896341F|nr:hypothetical protein [Nocardia blacklockiae]MBF6170220.1 hypothetical protein [Nocardia blacklockiae]
MRGVLVAVVGVCAATGLLVLPGCRGDAPVDSVVASHTVTTQVSGREPGGPGGTVEPNIGPGPNPGPGPGAGGVPGGPGGRRDPGGGVPGNPAGSGGTGGLPGNPGGQSPEVEVRGLPIDLGTYTYNPGTTLAAFVAAQIRGTVRTGCRAHGMPDDCVPVQVVDVQGKIPPPPCPDQPPQGTGSVPDDGLLLAQFGEGGISKRLPPQDSGLPPTTALGGNKPPDTVSVYGIKCQATGTTTTTPPPTTTTTTTVPPTTTTPRPLPTTTTTQAPHPPVAPEVARPTTTTERTTPATTTGNSGG